MNKNTLYITFDGLSDPLGQSQILPYVIALAREGFCITVLSCEKPEALQREQQKIVEKFKGLPVEWKYIEYSSSGNALTRFSYIKQLGRMAFAICDSKKISLTHCRSYLSALIGLKLKQQKGIPFLFDMRGFWADERVDGGIWKKSNPFHLSFYNYFKRKEKQFIQQADHIVSLTHAAVKEMDKLFPAFQLNKRTNIIPCCTDLEKFDHVAAKPAGLPKGINENDFLLIYIGSVGTWYHTKEMIDCILVWKEQIPNIKLLVLTKDQSELSSVLENYSASQRELIVTASASYSEVPSYLALAKAAIYFIKPVYSKIASCPTKMAEFWAMNLPIITNRGIGDNDLYFKEKNGGVLLSEFTNEEYKRAANIFMEHIRKNINYRTIAESHFDNKKAAKAYLKIYTYLSA